MSEAIPLTFPSLDEPPERPAWMSPAKHAMRPAPFLGEAGYQQAFDEAETTGAGPAHEHGATQSRSRSVLPSAPQEHAPLSEGGLRPSMMALPPASTPQLRSPLNQVAAAQETAEISVEKRAFAEALVDIATLRARALREAEQSLTDLSVKIAQAILERELDSDPSLHVQLVRSTLAAFGDPHGAKLRASQRTYDAIVEVYGSTQVDFDGVSVSLIRDASLDGLGCVVEGEVNLVDGRVEERLAAVWRAFRAENQRRALEESP